MDFYLYEDYKEDEKFHFPVNPGEVSIKRDKLFETVSIINIGEIDFPYGQKIKEISFSSFFPAKYDASYCRHSNLLDPQEAMNKLTAWMMSNKPVRLNITETIINVLVLVSAHNTTFKGGEPGDVYFDLTCRTWRDIKVRTAAEAAAPVTAGGVAVEPRPDIKPVPAIYVVKPGDSLWAIAKLQYGDGAKWRDIYDANKDKIGPDPNLITIGLKLLMPA